MKKDTTHLKDFVQFSRLRTSCCNAHIANEYICESCSQENPAVYEETKDN